MSSISESNNRKSTKRYLNRKNVVALEATEDAQDLLIAKKRIAKAKKEGTYTAAELREKILRD